MFTHCLRRIGAPGHMFRALYPMLFMQNFGALLTVKATDYNLEVTNDRMNLPQITEQHFAK